MPSGASAPLSHRATARSALALLVLLALLLLLPLLVLLATALLVAALLAAALLVLLPVLVLSLCHVLLLEVAEGPPGAGPITNVGTHVRRARRTPAWRM